MNAKQAVIEAHEMVKTFNAGAANEQCVLDHIDLTITAGERLAIIGPSGSGKSTLLHCISGMDVLSSGRVCIVGQDVAEMNEQQRAQLRNQHIGFIFQDHHLLPHCSLLENILMPCLAHAAHGKIHAEEEQWAQSLLDQLGLTGRGDDLPQILSGGERQRVAVARALMMKPSIVIADEPTGSLDRATAIQVADILDQLQQSCGCALLVVTHDEMMAKRMDRMVAIDQGKIVDCKL